MGKLYEVLEFDTITCHPGFENIPGFCTMDEGDFRDLLRFTRELGSQNDETADCLQIGYRRKIGDIIKVKNYVGLIQTASGVQIQILPKVHCPGENSIMRTKQVFLEMLRSLKNFPGQIFSNADLHAESMNLYEIYIAMYVQMVSQLVKKGLQSAYIRTEENLPVYKGKLLTQLQIKHNAAHKERFFVAYDVFSRNRPENRILKATLLKLQRTSRHNENRKELQRLLSAFDDIEPSVNYAADFAAVASDRSVRGYAQALEWSRIFLWDKSFSTFAGESSATAMLFPMEKLFESYVTRWAYRIFTPAGWDVTAQDRSYCLFTEAETDRKLFQLLPDIVLRKGNRTVIMDTKWKKLSNDPKKNYNISQADMYQMYAYACKYHAAEVFVLYPANEDTGTGRPIRFDSDPNVRVHIKFIDLEHIAVSMQNLLDALD